MATTAIWDVTDRLDRVIDYATNPDKTENNGYANQIFQGLRDVLNYTSQDGKTEKQFYVSGINCDPATACKQMSLTKLQFQKTDGILAFHGYQSFAPGEATPESAHAIGVKLAQELWGDRFEVVVSTHYKYITYTTPEGQKCRDNKLHETKYLKAEMEGYFNAKLRGIETAQQAGKPSGRTHGTDSHTALPAAGQRHTDQPMEHDAGEPDRSHPAIAGIGDAYLHPAYRGRRKQDDEELLPGHLRPADGSPVGYDSEGASADYGDNDFEYGEDDGYDWMEDDEYTESLGGESPAQGHVAAENQGQMGRHRSIDFDDIVALAKAVDDLVNPYNPEEEREKKKKYVPKGDHKKQKKKHHNNSHDYDLSL